MNVYEKLSHITQTGGNCVLINVVDKQGEGPVRAGSRMLVEVDGTLTGTVGGGTLEYTAVETAKGMMKTGGTRLETYILQDGKLTENATTLPMVCGGKVTLFYECISGGDPVYIFGGGHVGKALCTVLNTMDFYTHVIENREDVFQSIDFASQKHLSDFDEFIRTHTIEPDCFIIICTPSHKYDYDVIRAVIQNNIKVQYAGMLASRTKLKDFTKKIEDEFGNIKLPFLYSPVGLDTGGSTPEEIAVSIAAEMLAVKYSREGNRHLRDI